MQRSDDGLAQGRAHKQHRDYGTTRRKSGQGPTIQTSGRSRTLNSPVQTEKAVQNNLTLAYVGTWVSPSSLAGVVGSTTWITHAMTSGTTAFNKKDIEVRCQGVLVSAARPSRNPGGARFIFTWRTVYSFLRSATPQQEHASKQEALVVPREFGKRGIAEKHMSAKANVMASSSAPGGRTQDLRQLRATSEEGYTTKRM